MGEGPEAAAPRRATVHRGLEAASFERSRLRRDADTDMDTLGCPGEQAAGAREDAALRRGLCYRRHGSPAASVPVKGGRGSVSPGRSVDGGGRTLTLFHRSHARKQRLGAAAPR